MQAVKNLFSGHGTTGTAAGDEKADLRIISVNLVEALPADLERGRFHPYIAVYKNGHFWHKSRTIKTDVKHVPRIEIADNIAVTVHQRDMDEVLEVSRR